MTTFPNGIDVSAEWREYSPDQRPSCLLTNLKTEDRLVTYAKAAITAYRGRKSSGLISWTNAGNWFASPGVHVAATLSGRTFLRNTIMPIELRPYQLEAVEKFAPPNIPNCAIFDEMGTGKTVMGVALDAVRRQDFPNGKTLVVCPGGAVVNSWARHFAIMQPHLKVVMLDPKARGRSWLEFKNSGAHVLIMHWEAVQIMVPDFLCEEPWLHVIADEVHRIKNKDTKAAKALKKVPTQFKLGLSGTPSTGMPDDLWSILNWLYPGSWRSYWNFRKRYTKQELSSYGGNKKFMKVTGPQNEEELQHLISMYTIRRLKREVLPHLKKNPIEHWTTMTPLQAAAYLQMTEEMVAWVHTKMEEEGATDEDELSPIIANAVISRLIRQQQFACAYCIVDADGNVHMSEPSPKCDVAWDLMQERLEEGRPVVLYSEFKQLLTLFEERLKKANIPYAKITGDVKQTDRDAAVGAFQRGDVDVFLGTIKAGGEGIDLFRSSCIIFLSRDWSPAKNQQAEDRLDRMGQENIVDVIDIYVEGTVERDKKDRVAMKWSWIKQLLGDDKKC
jgi:non-specific serine/threonine protein kinase